MEEEERTLDYSDPDVVMGNIQAIEGAFVRLLYALTAIKQLSKAEAEDCFSYSAEAAAKTPELGPTHKSAYQFSLLRMKIALGAMHERFPLL